MGVQRVTRDTINRGIEPIGWTWLAAALGQKILFEHVWNGLFHADDGPRNQSAKAWADDIDSFRSPWRVAFFDLGNHARYGDVAAWVRELGRGS